MWRRTTTARTRRGGQEGRAAAADRTPTAYQQHALEMRNRLLGESHFKSFATKDSDRLDDTNGNNSGIAMASDLVKEVKLDDYKIC